MATVLVIASDRMIGGLLGQLCELTGHAAQFCADHEALDDAMRFTRADVVMFDAAYGLQGMDLAAALAAEAGVALVYFAAGVQPAELGRLALQRRAKYFALPAGPRLLARVLVSALADRATELRTGATASGFYAVTCASAAVSRARALADMSRSIRQQSRALIAEHDAMLADCRRLRGTLRDAVIAYTREMRGAGVPPERALEMVKSALHAQSVGPQPPTQMAADIDDAVEWCLQAYYAA